MFVLSVDWACVGCLQSVGWVGRLQSVGWVCVAWLWFIGRLGAITVGVLLGAMVRGVGDFYENSAKNNHRSPFRRRCLCSAFQRILIKKAIALSLCM